VAPAAGPILDRMANGKGPASDEHLPMHEERMGGARFTRLTMVRLGGAGGGVRRYGLARLDEIALASPPARAVGAETARDDTLDDGAAPCDG
jgi:hypothetical protein